MDDTLDIKEITDILSNLDLDEEEIDFLSTYLNEESTPLEARDKVDAEITALIEEITVSLSSFESFKQIDEEFDYNLKSVSDLENWFTSTFTMLESLKREVMKIRDGNLIVERKNMNQQSLFSRLETLLESITFKKSTVDLLEEAKSNEFVQKMGTMRRYTQRVDNALDDILRVHNHNLPEYFNQMIVVKMALRDCHNAIELVGSKLVEHLRIMLSNKSVEIMNSTGKMNLVCTDFRDVICKHEISLVSVCQLPVGVDHVETLLSIFCQYNTQYHIKRFNSTYEGFRLDDVSTIDSTLLNSMNEKLCSKYNAQRISHDYSQIDSAESYLPLSVSDTTPSKRDNSAFYRILVYEFACAVAREEVFLSSLKVIEKVAGDESVENTVMGYIKTMLFPAFQIVADKLKKEIKRIDPFLLFSAALDLKRWVAIFDLNHKPYVSEFLMTQLTGLVGDFDQFCHKQATTLKKVKTSLRKSDVVIPIQRTISFVGRLGLSVAFVLKNSCERADSTVNQSMLELAHSIAREFPHRIFRWLLDIKEDLAKYLHISLYQNFSFLAHNINKNLFPEFNLVDIKEECMRRAEQHLHNYCEVLCGQYFSEMTLFLDALIEVTGLLDPIEVPYQVDFAPDKLRGQVVEIEKSFQSRLNVVHRKISKHLSGTPEYIELVMDQFHRHMAQMLIQLGDIRKRCFPFENWSFEDLLNHIND
ncbi:hypothetical protein PCE1_002496 [Barthelona sp. PCE]